MVYPTKESPVLYGNGDGKRGMGWELGKRGNLIATFLLLYGNGLIPHCDSFWESPPLCGESG